MRRDSDDSDDSDMEAGIVAQRMESESRVIDLQISGEEATALADMGVDNPRLCLKNSRCSVVNGTGFDGIGGSLPFLTASA